MVLVPSGVECEVLSQMNTTYPEVIKQTGNPVATWAMVSRPHDYSWSEKSASATAPATALAT